MTGDIDAIERLRGELAQAAQINSMMKKYTDSVMEVANKYAQDAEMMRRVIFTLVGYAGGHLAIPVEDIIQRKYTAEDDGRFLYLDVVEEDTQ